MSTDGFAAFRRRAALVLGVAVLAPAARAAYVDFRPVLSFGLSHDGNVQVVGESKVGDETATIAADLAVDRTTPASAFSFFYRPRYVWYRQNSDLDYLENTIQTTYSKVKSRRTRIDATLDATRTDFQGITPSSADLPATFVPRTTITRAYGTVTGTVGVAQRSFFDWQVRAGAVRFKQIPGVSFDNSTFAAARTGWRYELSERSTLGLAVTIGWFGYDIGPSVVGEALVLTGTYTLGKFTTMNYDAGVARTTSNGVSNTSGAFLLSFDRVLSKVSNLTAGVRQLVTPGTGLQGATSDSGAWISFTQLAQRSGLQGLLDGAYWYRRGLQFGDTPTSDTGTLNLSGALGWRFNRLLSLNAAYLFFYQNVRSGSTGALDTRYSSYGLFLRWGIRGLPGAPGARAR